MQFRDLATQYNVLKEEIDRNIQSVLNNHAFINGKEVKQLETELAQYVGVKHCVACASGTDALILPLMAWGIGAGDAVFAPDFTYFASINCAMLRGATPILVDIDKRTFNMSPAALDKAIEAVIAEGKLVPKVIIPVDLFGLPAEHDSIQKIADKYNMKVLEDGAQGFGGNINGIRACSFGDAASTSFFPAKPLGCYGDGGAIFTNNDELAVALRSMRMQGSSPQDKYDNITIGLNSRLDTLQAAILLPKLHALVEHELNDVNEVAKRYTKALNGYVKTPCIPSGYSSSWAQYTILLKDKTERDGLQQYLKSKGIPSMIYYPRGMHQQSALKTLRSGMGEFPNTQNAVASCLSLPMGPYLNITEQDDVVNSVLTFLGA